MKTIRSVTHALMLALTVMIFIGFSTFTAHAANCDGLQTTGNIPAGTYTLTDNCVITGILTITAGTTVTINGAGFAIDANHAFDTVISVETGGTLNLNNVTIRNGNVFGIANYGTARITNSTLSGNDYGFANYGTGTATFTNSTLSGNNQAGVGNDASATITVTNSTISGNGIIGIENYGTATVTNSTISGNRAIGIENYYGTITVTNSTISGNRGIGIGNSGTATATVTNSIVSANRWNCYGTLFTNNGGNLEDVNTCRFGTGANTDPMLGAFNGSYYPLLAGSPAIDGAPNCAGLTDDQIGTSRPQGVSCDIGAIEVQVDPVTGEIIVMQAPAVPSLNEWNATASESRAEAYGMQDNVYATIHMQNGAWQYNSGGIPQELIDYGVIFAIDVWELGGDQVFEHYEKVCLLGEGRLVYFDATQSPRPMVEIMPVTFEDGYTCGWIPNAGTIVLIEPE